MRIAEGSAQARLQDQQPKIDRATQALNELLRKAVVEQRHGRVAVSVNIQGGLLTLATMSPEFTEKL